MNFEKVKKIIIENAVQGKITKIPRNSIVSDYPVSFSSLPDVMKIKYDIDKNEYHISCEKSDFNKHLPEEDFNKEFGHLFNDIKEEEITSEYI